MALGSLQLAEPLVDAMVLLLSENLSTVIDEFNESISDGYTVPYAAQILPYVPVPSTLQGGMPAIGVQEIGGDFVDDLQFSTDAVHQYAVAAIIQNSDQLTLAMQLRRMMQCIAYTIQQDRMLGTTEGSGGIMRTTGTAYSVNLLRTEPGPLLADLDPTSPEAPPRAYLSWTALTMESRRREV